MGQFKNDKLKIIFKKIKPHKQLHKDINLTEAIKALLRVIMMANNSYWQFFYHLFRSKLVRSIHQQCNSILLFEWKPPNKQPHTFYSNCKRSKYFRTISWMFHFLFTHSVCRPADGPKNQMNKDLPPSVHRGRQQQRQPDLRCKFNLQISCSNSQLEKKFITNNVCVSVCILWLAKSPTHVDIMFLRGNRQLNCFDEYYRETVPCLPGSYRTWIETEWEDWHVDCIE